MPTVGSGTVPKPLESVVLFIDGGYIRSLFQELFEHDRINFTRVAQSLVRKYNTWPPNPHRANLIRTYYYDGIVDPEIDTEAFKQQRAYFDNIEGQNQCIDVTLGELIKDDKGCFRQKGVDILLAIDALAMTYQDTYESALFLVGDRDFIPLIEAIKNTGKKTFGFFYIEKVARELVVTFDFRSAFNKEEMKKWI